MYCKQCGKEVMEQSVVCPNCGALVRKDAAKSKSINWAIIGGAIALFISTFMPVVSMWGSSTSYMEVAAGDGLFIMVMALAAGLLGFFKLGTLSFIPAVIAFFKSCVDLEPAFQAGGDAQIGFIVLFIACIVIVSASVVEIVKYVKRKRNPFA